MEPTFKYKELSYKLKTKPENFKVTEKLNINLLDQKAPFTYYLLEKKNWNTLEVIDHLQKKWSSFFDYGGLKDKHAHTFQFISSSIDIEEYQFSSFNIKKVGYYHEKMNSHFIHNNHFEIILTHLKREEISIAKKNMQILIETGIPNYFDEQRFQINPLIEDSFFTFHLMNQNLKNAIEVFILQKINFLKSQNKKEYLLALNFFLKKSKNKTTTKDSFLNSIFLNNSILKIIESIPRNELSLNLSALQSLYWNENLKKKLMHLNLQGVLFQNHKINLFFPILNKNEKLIVEELESKELRIPLEIKYNQCNSFNRKTLFFPENLIIHPYEKEADNFFQMKIEFEIQSSSYATLFIKRAFLKINRI